MEVSTTTSTDAQVPTVEGDAVCEQQESLSISEETETAASISDDLPLSTAAVPWYKFDNVKSAQGYNTVGAALGALLMSNVYLSLGLIFLASKEAGCLNEAGDAVVEDCNKTVYSFQPSSFVSATAVIAGVFSALFMPLVGAMIDYTEFRRTVGATSALVIVLIQAVQIGTVSETWFAMTILQAIKAFLYQVQMMAAYSYLADTGFVVGQEKMTKYTSLFNMVQFLSETCYLIVISALSVVLGLGDVGTAQLGQCIATVWCALFFGIGWRQLPHVAQKHVLPEGQSLWTQGFVQVYHTAVKIRRHYNHGLLWYFLALTFGEAAAYGYTVLAVIYLDSGLGMSASEIGVFFVLTILGAIPGTFLSTRVTQHLDPNRSWQLCLLCMTIWMAGGSILTSLPQGMAYVWGAGAGILFGWHYPVESLFFATCLPKGQEAELSGFFVYCTQIIAWLPPLIFTALVEANVSEGYAVVSISGFFVVAIAFLRCASSWDVIQKEKDGLNSNCIDDDDDVHPHGT